jgi:hypothetical protein
MIKRWNTLRLALYGACVGALWAAFQSAPLWRLGGDYTARAIGHLIGGAAGAAALVAIVSGTRNLLLHAKR